MNRKKKDVIILAVLLPVMLFIIFNGWSKKGRNASLQKDEEAGQSVPKNLPLLNNADARNPETILKEQIELEELYMQKGIPRNPFAQPVEIIKAEGKFLTITISGVFYTEEDNKNPHAIINGKILAKGDTFKGLIVEVINAEDVVLRGGEKTYKIKVGAPAKIQIP
jgi:hypothetical protein